MPLYELFCLAKPRLAKQQLADIIKLVGKSVIDKGGVITDIKSFGEQPLAYEIRRPGEKYAEVRFPPTQHNRYSTPPSLYFHAVAEGGFSFYVLRCSHHVVTLCPYAGFHVATDFRVKPPGSSRIRSLVES
jgi:hypothetical protein